MKNLHRLLMLSALLFSSVEVLYGADSAASLSQNQPSQNQPSQNQSKQQAELFWISDGHNNRDITISADAKLMLSTVMAPKNRFSAILIRRKLGGEWSEPELAPFSGKFPDIEPMFTPDSNRLWFSSRRPLDGQEGEKKDWDLWYVDLDPVSGRFSSPVNPGKPVNSETNEFYPSVASNGNLYFTSDRPGGFGKEDIYRFSPGKNSKGIVERLGEGVNTSEYEFNSFISADETYILFTGTNRMEGLGRGDLYISRKNSSGTFAAALNLGPSINSPQLDYCPFVFKNELYFTSEKSLGYKDISNARQFMDMIEAPGNGLGDIYKISFPQ